MKYGVVHVDELTKVVASVFKKKSSSELSLKEFEFALSFDFKWISPDEASRVSDMAIESNIVYEQDGYINLNINLDNVSIPHDFKPSDELFKEKSTIEQIMEYITVTMNIDKQKVASLINGKQEEYSELLYPEVSAILVAKELGCDITPFYQKIYKKILQYD
ncbi:DUF2240 family protein [Methanohalobium sp.]|uniref:DUF2240 family protein n=1 Tax=Methanohalobium sp. TaxID=2837493 RepID=UPI0025DCB5FC|nr:DUF2240 family protein [Methanohalobium sp.]